MWGMGEGIDGVGSTKVEMWGTREELILGAAIMRHGAGDWNVVASELRARSVDPHLYTPQACKTKYEDLQKLYSCFSACYEELRKRRVAELKRELEKSEDSIQFLKAKLERLYAGIENFQEDDHHSTRSESPLTSTKQEGTKTYCKELPKDELSAGSFTKDVRTKTETCNEIFRIEKLEGNTSCSQGGTLRKRRGKRKKKDCNWDARLESSTVERGNIVSSNLVGCNETSTSGCGQTVGSSSVDVHDGASCRGRSDDLVGIFNSIAENQYALVFKRRLDSQKRARYRNIVRQHMDFDTMRMRIANSSIKSARELFRDLLLLANNAIIFYSKRTREHKYAVCLRDIIMNRFRQHCNDSSNKTFLSSIFFLSPTGNLPVKPRSFRSRPSQPKFMGILSNIPPRGYLKPNNADSSTPSQKILVKIKNSDIVLQGHSKERNGVSAFKVQSLDVPKSGIGRPRNNGGGKCNRGHPVLITKERKRSRQR